MNLRILRSLFILSRGRDFPRNTSSCGNKTIAWARPNRNKTNYIDKSDFYSITNFYQLDSIIESIRLRDNDFYSSILNPFDRNSEIQKSARFYPAAKSVFTVPKSFNYPSGLCMVKIYPEIDEFHFRLLRYHPCIVALFKSVSGGYVTLFKIPQVKNNKEYKAFHESLCFDLSYFNPNRFENQVYDYFHEASDSNVYYNPKASLWDVKIIDNHPVSDMERFIYTKAGASSLAREEYLFYIGKALSKIGIRLKDRKKMLSLYTMYDLSPQEVYAYTEKMDLII